MMDKEVIDGIIAKMNEDINKELMEKARKNEEARKLMKEFQDERKAMLSANAKKEAEEDAAIRAYMDLLDQRQLLEEKQKREEQDKKHYLWSKVTQESERHRSMKEEYDDLRTLLWEEELEEKKRKQEEDERLKHLRLKQENIRLNNEQIQAKKEKLKAYEDEERKLAKMMLDKFTADEDKERLRREQIALAKRHLAADAQRLKDEKQRIALEEKCREEDELRASQQSEEFRQRVISEARKRLLATHAANIKGYLPKVNECVYESIGQSKIHM